MLHRMRAWGALGLVGGLSACGFGAGQETPSGAPPSEPSPVTVTRQVETPPCEAPAPLHLVPDEARIPDEYLVRYRDGDVEDPDALTLRLEERYGFRASARFRSLVKGFAALLPPATVAALRCEQGVEFVEEQATASRG